MQSMTALTVDEFEKLQLDENVRYELSEGELIIVGTAAARHEMVKSRIVEILVLYVSRNRIGRVFAETSFVLGSPTFRMPDIAFVGNSKLAHYDPYKMFRFAPDLVIEIVSNGDSAADLETRIEQFLSAGSQAVCIVYMQPKKVYLHEPAGVRIFEETDVLEIPAVLPGFSVKIADFFE